MRKGTTPSLTFKLPFTVGTISNAKVTLCQRHVKLEKRLCDCEINEEDSLTIKLTQEETFLFDCNSYINVQLRVVTENGDALASDVFNIPVAQCLDDEVIS